MEDLIPFLIVIAISIIGAASRKKKKRISEGNITSSQQEPSDDNFLSWMEKIAGVEEEPVNPYQKAEVVVEPSHVNQVVEEPVVVKDLIDNKYSKYSGIKHKGKQEVVEADIEPTAEVSLADEIKKSSIRDAGIGNDGLERDFDLEKAIVYSTILDRKYC